MKFSLSLTDNISYIQSEFLVKETTQIAYSFGDYFPNVWEHVKRQNRYCHEKA